MALFDFLKGLTPSDRRELEAKYAQLVEFNELKKQVEALKKTVSAIDMSGYAKTKDIPKLPDIPKLIQSEVAKIPVYSKEDKAKVDNISKINIDDYVKKKDLTDTAKYWLDQNSTKKFTLFVGAKLPTKPSADQLTILT